MSIGDIGGGTNGPGTINKEEVYKRSCLQALRAKVCLAGEERALDLNTVMQLALILLVIVASTQATPYVYTRTAPVYVQPAAVSYASPVVYKEAPKPYSFSYQAPAIGGGSSRQESSDGDGRVTGSYTVTDADGRVRVVDYYADETGFHANVKTNEPGTANQDSADVSVQSYAAPVAKPQVVAPVRYVAVPVRTLPRRYVAPIRTVTYNDFPAYPYSTPLTYSSVSPFYDSKLAYYYK